MRTEPLQSYVTVLPNTELAKKLLEISETMVEVSTKEYDEAVDNNYDIHSRQCTYAKLVEWLCVRNALLISNKYQTTALIPTELIDIEG